ncbi:S-adenosylmethionine-binding protein [Ensifer sp. Root142]|uniref:MT-A70 family methyltransferase n=1 Tax=Ensifer sp. Root142 TaxID=1736461 RepID=UPI00070F4A91|nr:MT-A70 family methyltransferase [Ensifer sp. Root142]KQY71336.1 S-adenosylmethionine-binding protein [Ensifer sp. Root142]
MTGSLPKNIGPNGQAVIEQALSAGSFRSQNLGDQRACRSLNGRQLLKRDASDAWLWYPTDRAYELAGHERPAIGVDLVNHWGGALELHAANHTQASDIAPIGIDGGGIDVMWTSPPCKHFAAPARPPALTRLPHHPLAALFPMIPDDELRELADDIAEHGQQQPVWLLDGSIIDGRNREAACHLIGIDAWTKEYEGDDPLGFVLSLNLRRRHLSESQRAMVAAKIVIWKRGVNQHTTGSANLPTRDAARMLSVSERAVIAARRIDTHGIKELSAAIRDGKISVHTGEALTRLEHEAQQDILRREKKDIIAQSKEIRRVDAEKRHQVRLAHMAHVAQTGAETAGRVGQKFPVIYADPPWKFGVHSEVTGREKSAENHYPTMDTDAICRLFGEIGAPAKDDAVLFLWATNPMLPDALRVMEAWGFAYVHHWIWDKEVAGTGYWGRDRHELLLIGRRGNPAAPLPGTQPQTVHIERKGDHSAKPDFYAETIERLYPDMHRLEMFCRNPRPGWTAWGYEAGEGRE